MEQETISILLVDDDQGDFEMTRAMLAGLESLDFDLDWVSSFEEGLDWMDREEHDVYLLDYFLEDRTGLDLLREAIRRGIRSPIILLTGRGSRDVDLEAMRAGAADYLDKGSLEPEGLERAIRYALERKRAEEAVHESEARHRTMFDHLPIGLYRVTQDGVLLEANPSLIRMLGYPDRETLQHSYADELYVNPADRERFWSELDEYGVVRGFETELRKLDGSTVRVRNTARLHRDEEGGVLYVEGALEDVTGLRLADDLRSSEIRFRALFDATAAGIAVIDSEGAILEANSALAEILGFSREEFEGMPFVELAAEDDRSELGSELAASTRTPGGLAGTHRRFVRKDGTMLWARATTAPLERADESARALVLLEDVSEAGESTGA